MIGAQASWHDICLLASHQRAVLASSPVAPSDVALGLPGYRNTLLTQQQLNAYANTAWRGIESCWRWGHALRTLCCAVATFAWLVVLGVACMIKKCANGRGDYGTTGPKVSGI